MTFPPVPVYPNAIDSDYTLFLVYNTTEAPLSSDNTAWAQEIPIVPVRPDKAEIWADSGFANIDGELLYYDSVEKNSYGKVNKLISCARNIGGDKTHFNKKGTMVRAYVVAEHHNQIVETILKIEDFVGINFDERIGTLDFRIRNLQALDIIFDDYDCPDVNFTFNVLEDDAETGVLTEFFVDVNPGALVNNYRLDFGDGSFTTTDFSGQHRYALNADIDPVVTMSNDKCELIQTPYERANPQEPSPIIEEAFDIPIPDVPDFPDFTFVPCEVPEADVVLPPLVFPCISIEGQIGPIPSSIEGPDIPSQIVIIGPDIPTTITLTPELPSIILLDPPIPPTIVIDPPIPPTIVIIPPPSAITLDIDVNDLPKLEIDWGSQPTMQVELAMAQQVKAPRRLEVDPKIAAEFGEEFADLFEVQDTTEVQYETVGFPTEIVIVPPNELPDFKFDTSSLESMEIGIRVPNIPDIKVDIDGAIPDRVYFDASDVPKSLDLVYRDKPIPIDASTIPESIGIVHDLPSEIGLRLIDPIPDTIEITGFPDRPLTIEGIPETLTFQLPDGWENGIPIAIPDKMPEMEVVYKGAPIELKITMDDMITKDESSGVNCVMITPCPR